MDAKFNCYKQGEEYSGAFFDVFQAQRMMEALHEAGALGAHIQHNRDDSCEIKVPYDQAHLINKAGFATEDFFRRADITQSGSAVDRAENGYKSGIGKSR
jgi:hypothetical protein